MREIKFRMWHKKSKKMYDIEKINIKDKLLNMWNSRFYSSSLFNFEEVELMQYTGLKDKNGVEIYEGDIVKTKENKIYQVIYAEDIASFECITKVGSVSLFALLSRRGAVEVIGNIYENPELLEEE